MDSLHQRQSSHPIGSVGIREMYEPDLTTARGFGLVVKTAEGWYFYEVFGALEGTAPAVSEYAAPGCLGCHAGGVDFVRSQVPLTRNFGITQ